MSSRVDAERSQAIRWVDGIVGVCIGIIWRCICACKPEYIDPHSRRAYAFKAECCGLGLPQSHITKIVARQPVAWWRLVGPLQVRVADIEILGMNYPNSAESDTVLLDIFGTIISSLKLVLPGFQVYNNEPGCHIPAPHAAYKCCTLSCRLPNQYLHLSDLYILSCRFARISDSH